MLTRSRGLLRRRSSPDGGGENISCLYPRKVVPQPHMRRVPITTDGFQEAIVTNNRALADVVAKAIYFSMAAAAFVFVSMLLLTGLHS
jgi:hypothetical protein